MIITNNFCEFINSKNRNYLPKNISSNYDFMNILTKIFIKSISEKTNKRHDYASRALIIIIIDEKIDENIRNIKYEEFKSKQKYIISGYESELEKYEINKLIDPINNINIISKYNIT